MKISVITVVYNAKEALVTTLESVFAQAHGDIEVESVVVDGGSTDGTPGAIGEFASRAACAPQLSLRWTSERDDGIYDAMNKGLALATGEWVLFMNAGDVFSADDTVASCFAMAREPRLADIIYGNCREVTPRAVKEKYAGDRYERLRDGLYFRHNAAFVRREFHLRHRYDVSLRPQLTFSLDSHCFRRMYLAGARIEFVDVDVVDYQKEGASAHLFRYVLNSLRIAHDLHVPPMAYLQALPRFVRALGAARRLFVIWQRAVCLLQLLPTWVLPEALALRLKGVAVGPDVRIKRRMSVVCPHFLRIGRGVKIGHGCRIDATAVVEIGDFALIGDDVCITTRGKGAEGGACREFQAPVVIDPGEVVAPGSCVCAGHRRGRA